MDDGTSGIPEYDSILGRQIYLIVETVNCRGKQLFCNVQSAPDSTLGSLTITSLTGNTDNLELVLGPSIWDSSSEPVTEVKTDFTCIVGELDILNNISGNRDHYINVYENPASSSYNIDHIDKAICKINLFPSDPTTFDTWSNNLATGIAALSITVQAEDGSELFFGNNSTLSDTPGEFLYENDEYDADARFRLVNRIAYDIFNANNTYNFLSMNGTNRKRVGRIENIFISSIADTDTINLSYRQVYYYYYDQIDNEHFICECQLYLPRRRSNGVILAQTSTIASIPAGHTSDQAAPAGGDAYWNYYYANGDIVVRDEHHAGDQPRNSTLSGPKDYGIVSYSEENDAAIIASLGINAEIVKMPEDLSISFTVNNVTTRILFTFTSTQRRYANHGCFAAFIGVLAQLSYTNVVSTGMCFEDATSYPSVSHPNGDSIDTVYLENQTKKRAIISAFSEWGFSYIISGTADTGDGADEHRADHNSHLHSGNFLDTNVHVLNR
jgi:hypothetical protein